MLLSTQHFCKKNSKNSCEQFKKVYLSGQKVSRRVLLRVVLLTFDKSSSVHLRLIIFNQHPLSHPQPVSETRKDLKKKKKLSLLLQRFVPKKFPKTSFGLLTTTQLHSL